MGPPGDRLEPYEIRWARVEHGATAVPRFEVLSTTESAFAPAVITNGVDAGIAWLEGDASGKGAVRAARLALDGKASPVAVAVSPPDEPNARDPELSGTLDAPALVYTSISKTRPGGVVRLARLGCVGSPWC